MNNNITNIYKLLIIKTILFITALISVACTGEDKVVDNSGLNSQILVAFSNPTKLSLINQQNSSISIDNILSERTGIDVKSNITSIYKYRENIYLLVPEEKRIIAINSTNYALVADIDLSQYGAPSDISFLINGTSAYITHPEEDMVTILDLTNFKIAKSIDIGKKPINLATVGNLVIVVNQLDNEVAIIDTRDESIAYKLPTQPVPLFVEITPDGEEAFIICLGNGKSTDNNLPKSESFALMLSLADRAITNTTELKIAKTSSLDLVPTSFTITQYDMGLITVDNYIMRLDTRRGDKISLVRQGNYHLVDYNSIKEEISVLSQINGSYKVEILNDRDLGGKRSYNLNGEVTCTLPL